MIDHDQCIIHADVAKMMTNHAIEKEYKKFIKKNKEVFETIKMVVEKATSSPQLWADIYLGELQEEHFKIQEIMEFYGYFTLLHPGTLDPHPILKEYEMLYIQWGKIKK